MPTNKPRIYVTLPEEIDEKINLLGEHYDLSNSLTILLIIQEWLDDKGNAILAGLTNETTARIRPGDKRPGSQKGKAISPQFKSN